MFSNLLLISWRIFKKDRIFSLIHILGLALGIVCCLFIYLYVRDELQYDRFNENYERIGYIGTSILRENEENHYSLASRTAGEFIRGKYPEIEKQSLVQKWKPTVLFENKYFNQDIMIFAEPEFLDIFTINMLEGNPVATFAEPFQIIISQKLRDRYFKNREAIGQSLTVNDTLQLQIAGVMEDLPHNSGIQTEAIISYETMRKLNEYFVDWTYLTGYLYVLMESANDFEALDKKLAPLAMEQFSEELKGSGMTVSVGVEKLSEQRLYSDRTHGFSPAGDIKYIYIFGTIGLFILLLGVINYINISTARAIERAREVGIRKVVGAGRGGLVAQFLSESVLVAGFALLLSLGLTFLLLPGFNQLTSKVYTFMDLLNPIFLLVALGLSLGTGLLAGTYPALVLSGFQPIKVLKGSFKRTAQGQWLRRGLVGTQFVISIGLIFCALVAYRQMQFMIKRDLGFSKDQVLVLDASSVAKEKLNSRIDAFKSDASAHPILSSLSLSSSIPGRGAPHYNTYPEGIGEGETRALWIVSADEDFPKTYGIQMLAGRELSKDYPQDDTASFLINEAVIREIGWDPDPEKALDKQIIFGDNTGRVVGVFKDFHYFSLKNELSPLLLFQNPNWNNFISVRIDMSNISGVTSTLEDIWKKHFPEYEFSYFFLDDDFAKQYQADDQLLTILGIFTGIGILIAIFGLIGLTTHSATQRMKEIGVRKVLGASVFSIVRLLGREMSIIVITSFLIGSILGYWLIDRWMQDFPYRIPIGPEAFLLTGLSAISLAWLFTGYIIFKATRRSPVHVLKSE
jgi:putative ABC transport system permease protein